MNAIKNKIYTLILFSITFFLSSFLTSNALNNNQLTVSIINDGDKLVINECWNTIYEKEGFKRILPISKDDINNINMETIFPNNEIIDFEVKYSQKDNSTTLIPNINTPKEKTFVLNIRYQLDLDKYTSEKFISALPNSLFKDNKLTIENIKLNIQNSGEEEITYYNNSTINDNEFVQETSKSMTIEVIMLLLKISFGLIFLFIFCTVIYIFAMYIYFRKIQPNKGTKFKHRHKHRTTYSKPINTKKRIKISKKF